MPKLCKEKQQLMPFQMFKALRPDLMQISLALVYVPFLTLKMRKHDYFFITVLRSWRHL